MKRATEQNLKKIGKGGKDLRTIITEYSKKGDASADLIAELEKLHSSYVERVYKGFLEETK